MKIEHGQDLIKVKGGYHFEDLVRIGDDFYLTDVLNKAVIKANTNSSDTALVKRFSLSPLSLVAEN